MGRPVGSVEPDERLGTRIVLEPDSALMMFTDGLIEQRAVSWEGAYAHLGQLAESVDHLDAEQLADRLLSGMLPRLEGSDDVALLVAVR